MRIRSRRPAHRVTTAHLQAAYPFVSEGGLGSEGVYIGRDVFGGSFCFDPWTLYGKEITGPNMLVIGQIGYAKSSLVKCLAEDTEIIDPVTGVPHTIADVWKDPELTRVLSIDEQHRVVAVPITAKVDTGFSPCLRVTFASGRAVTTTPEHPFLLPDGWRRAEQLKVGETAATPARIPFPEEPVRLPDAEVDLLAVILAAGSFDSGQAGGVGFTASDPDVVRLMQAAGERIGFEVRPKGRDAYTLVGQARFSSPPDGVCACGCGEPTLIAPRRRHGSVKGQPRRYAPGHASRRSAAVAVLRRHGVERAGSKDRGIPEVIYRLPPDQLARVLAIFWMCGGTVDAAGVSATLASERMARQLQHLLLRFGVQSRVRWQRSTLNGEPSPSWQLGVEAHCEQRFLEKIPVWGSKRSRLLRRCSARQRAAQPDVASPSLAEELRARLDAAARLPDSEDIVWDRIVSIEDAGEQHVYDLTVQPNACFIANDVIVHNTYLWRQMLFGRTAWVIDPKGEYNRLAAYCGVEPIRFMTGGTLRLNPLDPMISGQSQLALLRSIGTVMLGRNLRPEEDACLERAHHEAVIEASNRGMQPVVPQVVNRLLDPSDATAHELRTSTARLAEDGRQLALALRRMGAGDLRGMFDGPTSPGIDLSGRLVVFNLREVKDEARPILMACTAAWLQGAWARNDGVRRIVVLDEAWVVLRHLAIARWLRESWKLARQYGVQNIAVMHRLSDLTAAGDAGSEQVQLAKGLLEDSETRVIYRQSPGEVEQARELLGLTQTEVEQIPTLERGEALWRVGRRSFIVQHRIDPVIEREIVDTDANMDGRPPPWAEREPDDAEAISGGAS